MNSKKLPVALVLIAAVLMAACSGAAVSLNSGGLLAQPETAVQPAATEQAEVWGTLADLQSTFEQIYTRVNPSVVNIQVVGGAGGSFGTESGLGSGFVWDREGHIVTNNHVVSGAGELHVTFSDGFTVEAELVGADPNSDLAVVKVDVDADRLQPVELADSSQVRVGQIAVAIGNPFGLQGTMTQGIVSGLARSLEVGQDSPAGGRYSIPDIVQTDAPINPGNSGGVLVDDQGRVIGVTSAIATTTQVNSGVGFAIPSAIVEKVVPELIQNGRFDHAWMGIAGVSLTPELAQAADLPEGQTGVMLLEVTPGGPADEAGLQAGSQETSIDGQAILVGGDVITAVDGQSVGSFEDLVSFLFNQTGAGQTIDLTVLRQGVQQTIQLTLGVRPE